MPVHLIYPLRMMPGIREAHLCGIVVRDGGNPVAVPTILKYEEVHELRPLDPRNNRRTLNVLEVDVVDDCANDDRLVISEGVFHGMHPPSWACHDPVTIPGPWCG